MRSMGRTSLHFDRRFRYSLRFLLIVVALVGVAFGWVHRGREQRQAAQRLRELNRGATVFYDYQVGADGRLTDSSESLAPAWLGERFGADYFSSVVGADLAYATDADLECLVRLPNLRRLYLARSVDVTDAGLAHLAKLKQLKLLVLDDADQVTDAGLRTLGRLKSLALLQLGLGRRMTPAGIEQLKRDLPNCRVEIDGLNGPAQLLAQN